MQWCWGGCHKCRHGVPPMRKGELDSKQQDFELGASCKWPGAKFLGLVKYSCPRNIAAFRIWDPQYINMYVYTYRLTAIHTTKQKPSFYPSPPKSWHGIRSYRGRISRFEISSLWLLWHALAEWHITHSTGTVRFIVAHFWGALWTVWWILVFVDLCLCRVGCLVVVLDAFCFLFCRIDWNCSWELQHWHICKIYSIMLRLCIQSYDMQRRGSTSHKYYCLELALCHAASLFTALPKNFWNLIDALCKLVPAVKASHHLQRHWPQSQRFRLYPVIIYPPKVWNRTWMKMELCRRKFLTWKPSFSGSMLILGRVCICGTSLSLFSWAQSLAKSAKIA